MSYEKNECTSEALFARCLRTLLLDHELSDRTAMQTRVELSAPPSRVRTRAKLDF